MDNVIQLQKKLVDYKTSLFNEGILDDQFTQLQQLQDESNPDFVVEVVSLFFKDSERLFDELAKTFIGAQRVQRVCILFRNYCEVRNIEECLKCLQQLKREYYFVKNKLETLFKLEKQIMEAGGTIPVQ
ncbi:hypothetical protein Pint_19931 [Pistacia integerrima]|uniref:Uncharacterized protein n=1 Tax=Pistacia integerrima TaxID=434235 RepID=A0ACC0XG44_9ROSI|nr:hypothetical protein Pint_19931 [Pistacia integerrima]